MKTDKNLRTIGLLLILSAAILFAIAMMDDVFKFEGNQKAHTATSATLALIFGLMLYFLNKTPVIKDYSEMNFDERAKFMAEQLLTGKRFWFANEFSDDKVNIYPLTLSNLDEMGGGKHTSLKLEEVRSLLKMNRVANVTVVVKIIAYMFNERIGDLSAESVYFRGNGEVYKKSNNNFHYRVRAAYRESGNFTWLTDGSDPERIDYSEVVATV